MLVSFIMLAVISAAPLLAQQASIPDATTIGVFRWDHSGTLPPPTPSQAGTYPYCATPTQGRVNTGFTQWWLDSNGSHGYEGSDQEYLFGLNCDLPIAGSWDGTRHLRVGTFWNGYWYVDVNDNHAWDAADQVYSFGLPGDVPVIGDWDHTGVLRIGVFRIDANTGLGWWYVNLHACSPTDPTSCSWRSNAIRGMDYDFFQWGVSGDVPVVGDWDHTGVLRIGVYRPGYGWIVNTLSNCGGVGVAACNQWGNPYAVYTFSIAGQPAVGDWTGSGSLRMGAFNYGTWYVDINSNNQWDGTGIDQSYSFGLGAFGGYPADTPVVGPWLPQITGISPSSGGAGTSVTITGANFGPAQGTTTVTFNGVAAQVTSWASNQIVAVVPGGATTGAVAVIEGGCTVGVCSATSAQAFTVGNALRPMAVPQQQQFSCGAPDCTFGYSQITYVSPYQFYGDSLVWASGPDSWNTLNTVSAKILQWPTTDLGFECSNAASTTGGTVADARVPCNAQTNFVASGPPSVYTLYGTHQWTNSLTNPSSGSFQTYDTLAFQRAGVVWTYNGILQDGFSNIATSSFGISVSPSNDGVSALYTAKGNGSVSVQVTIPYSARKGRHQFGFPANDSLGQLHPNQTFAITVYDDTPQITSVTPSPIQAGASTNVTITGTAFGDNPTIYVGGTGCSGGTVYNGVSVTNNSSGIDTVTIPVTTTAAQAGTSLSVCVKSNGAGGQPFTGKQGGLQTSNTQQVGVVGPPTISGSQGLWWLGRASVNDNCDPASSSPNCYYNSTVLAVTPGQGGSPPSAASPANWRITDPSTNLAPGFATFACNNSACSQITVTATGQPSYCRSGSGGNVNIQVFLAGISSAVFNVFVDWPQYVTNYGPLDTAASGSVPGYISTNPLQLSSGCGTLMYNIAWHEEFPTDSSGNPASWNTCGASQGWTSPIPEAQWAYGITDSSGLLTALGPGQNQSFDGVGYACSASTSPACTPPSNIPGGLQSPPQSLDPTANAWSYQFIYVGSQDTHSLGKYWPAAPNKQVRYTDHGRDEAGTWTCPGQ